MPDLTLLQPFNLNTTGNFTFANTSVTGNLSSGNANLGNLVSANYFSGNGSLLTGIIASSATTAATVTTNAQPNITSVGTLSSLTITGNITSGNASLGNLATASYFSGDGSLLTGLPSGYANSDVATFLASYGSNIINTTGNITAGYFIGNGSTLSATAGANVTGNVTSAVQSHFANIANSVAGANISGQVGNALVAGTVYTNTQPNITSVGTLASLSVTGNITSGNASLGNLASATYFSGDGIYLSNIAGGNVSGIVANATYATSAGTATSATTAATVTTNAQPNITSVGTLASLTVTGNITSGNASLGNLATANYFSGNGSLLTGLPAGYANSNVAAYLPTYTGNVAGNYFIGNGSTLTNITGSNVDGNVTSAVQSHYANIANSVAGSNVSGQVGNALVASTVYTNAQPNITSVGTLSSLSVSGDATVTGNFTVGGTTTYINVETFRVEDPIIELGGGANGDPLTTNDGKDRGTLLHYYTTGVVDAFMGWDNSNGEFAFGSNVSVSSEVVTFNNFGNIRASYFIGNGSQLTGTIANANYSTYAGTVITSAQPNITSVGTLASLTITGNITSGNADLGNLATASYFTGNGSLLTYITGSNVNGNVTSAVQSHYANIANSVAGSNVSGQVGNALVAGTVYTNAQPNITSVGTIAGLTGTGVFDLTGTSNVALGAVGNVHISGGTAGYVLSTDGSGALSWVAQSGGGGSYGNSNVADYLPTYTGNVSANYFIGNGSVLTGQVGNALIAGTVYTNAQPNITSVGSLNSLTVTGLITATGTGLKAANVQDSSGTITITTKYNSVSGDVGIYGNLNVGTSGTGFFIGDGGYISNITASNITGQVGNALIAGTVTTNAQPNITSVGSLSGLTVSNATGVVDFTTTANVTLGNVSNLHISGGSANYVLQTDGSGILSWVAQTGGGGGGTPGGSDTYVQFNDSSTFGGNAGLTFNKTSTTLTANNFIATSTANLGAVGNITITGGTSGYFLRTNGSGVLSWVAPSAPVNLSTTPSIAGGTLAIDLTTYTAFEFSLTLNITSVTISNVPAAGIMTSFMIVITGDGTPRSVTWPASFKWPSGTAPSITSTLNKKDAFVFFSSDGGTSWIALISGQNI